MKKLKLVDGSIPPHTVCPAMAEDKCGFAKACPHKGADHETSFSCGALRFWALTKEGEQFIETPNWN